LIELQNIAKTYRENGVAALSGVDFSLREGEIHAVVGENGAGKSTLMHVLGGFIKPDTGRITVNGKTRRFLVPASALRAGIGMIRQRPALVEAFTVWENCALGSAMRGGGFFLNRKAMRETVGAAIASLGFNLPLDAKAGRLTLAGQKKTAALSLVMHGAAFYIFDEPFAHLGRGEKEEMTRLFFSLRDAGKGVAVIAHEIREILPVSNRVTVLRHGRVALTGTRKSLNEARIVEAMFGKTAKPRPAASLEPGDGAAAAIEVKHLFVNHPLFHPLTDICFEARRGEIIGITGVREAGVETLEYTLAGFVRPESGAIEAADKNPARFAYIGPGLNGVAEPFAPALSIRDNLILHAHRRYTRKSGFLDTKALAAFAAALVGKAGIPAAVTAPASSLSGGMLARVIAERELARGADVLLLSDPEAGLDVQALYALMEKIRAFTGRGGAAVLFLGGGDGLFPLCSRVFHLENGRIRPFENDRGGEMGKKGKNGV
jgi:simple sugar transport system ATP-binding protein